MSTDSVADALIRIKNGYRASKTEVLLSYSKQVLAICKLLEKEGYIESVKQEKNGIFVVLKYNGKESAVTDVKRISKPGLRVYKNKKALPYVLNGLGIAIVSTPKGILTDKQARKEGVGGEVMAFVW